MSELHRVHALDVPPQPWRNAGGTTRELLAWPVHAPHWQLRVSVATVDAGGAFSAYPETTRWLAVLQGAGVRLDLPRGRVAVGPGDEPVSFLGEAAPTCELLEGPTLDLNLIVQRDAGGTRMWRARPGDAIDGTTRWRGLYALDAAVLDVEGIAEPVGAHTLLWSDAADAGRWQVRRAGTAAWFMTLQS